MIECYSLPTAKPYTVTAQYERMGTNKYEVAVTLANVVAYQNNGRLDGDRLGIKFKVQISTSLLADKPGFNDKITIDGQAYKLIDPVLKKNPAFVPFWEAEIKTVK